MKFIKYENHIINIKNLESVIYEEKYSHLTLKWDKYEMNLDCFDGISFDMISCFLKVLARFSYGDLHFEFGCMLDLDKTLPVIESYSDLESTDFNKSE